MAPSKKKRRVEPSASRNSSNETSYATIEEAVRQNGKKLELLLKNVDLLIENVASLEDKIESRFALSHENIFDEDNRVISLNFLADVRRLCVRYTDIIALKNKLMCSFYLE